MWSPVRDLASQAATGFACSTAATLGLLSAGGMGVRRQPNKDGGGGERWWERTGTSGLKINIPLTMICLACSMGFMSDDRLFRPADPDRKRAQREYTGLFHIAERHGDTPERRARQAHPDMLGPYGAARIIAGLAGGGLAPQPDEDAVDDTDVLAALTLMPKLRLEIDELETMLLLAARRSGITWQHIAYGLGLGSAQAARQRYDRLVQRTSDTDRDNDDEGAESGSSTDA